TEHHVDEHQGGQVDVAAVGQEGPDHRGGNDEAPHQSVGCRAGRQYADGGGRAWQGRDAVPQGSEVIAEQVEQEDEQRGSAYLHSCIHAAADQYQPGTLLLQADAHQQATEDEHDHGGYQRGFEIAQQHTFSTSGRPRRPLGRTSSTRNGTLKATTSLYSALKNPAVSASATPSRMPPSTAPGMLPMPPSTAAVKALSPAMKPMQGLITP